MLQVRCWPQPRPPWINYRRLWSCILSTFCGAHEIIGAYFNDELIVFHGNHSDDWLHNWLKIFQSEVDWLLGTADIFTMEIWRPGLPLRTLDGSKITVPGIGTSDCVTVNRNYLFPCLDIQLSWNDVGKIKFTIYKKLSELIKCLNTDSHHRKNHKTAVLHGVELCLTL